MSKKTQHPECQSKARYEAHATRYTLYAINVNPRRGFTLIETFVAVTVLVFAISGPLTLVSDALFASLRARDQLTATYLAERTVEGVRNIRDRSVKSEQQQDEWFDECYAPNYCIFDVAQATFEDKITQCGGGSGTCDELMFRESTGEYGYDDGGGGWVASKFTTYFTVESIQATGDEIEITATTEFQAGFVTKRVEITNRFLTWQ